MFPCSLKQGHVPLFPMIFSLCSLVPQNPWETLSILIVRRATLLYNYGRKWHFLDILMLYCILNQSSFKTNIKLHGNKYLIIFPNK